jgi:hypothetical protein
MLNYKNFLISILFLIIANTLIAGGGWPQPKNHGYFKLSEWWVISNQHFTDNGMIDPNVTTGTFNTSLYAEYGFTDRFTGILYFPFFSRTYNNNIVSGTTGNVIVPGEAINSIGDTDISLKYGLLMNKPIALSATLTFGLPIGNPSGGSQENLQTGDGEFNQMLLIDAGTSFKVGKLNPYANAFLGFNNRNGGYSDEWRFGIEAGAIFFKKKVIAIMRCYGIQSLKNGSRNNDNNSGTSLFANNSEFLTISPEIGYNINKNWGVSVTYATAVAGKLIFANPSYSVGVFYNLK